jgi:membrane protease YdiL (CAAX protease family)
LKNPARLLLYLAGTVILGAAIAPPLYWLGHAGVALRALPALGEYDFESYFHRALLIAAISLLWPLLRWVDVRSAKDLVLERNPRAGADCLVGFLIAMIPLLCCGAILIAAGVYSLRQQFLWSKMPAVLIASTVVPFIEELLFRGFILGVLVRSLPRIVAILLTSALFSIIHFLKPPEQSLPNDAVNWLSGFNSIAHSFSQFSDPLLIAGGFLTLFAIGWILADARLARHSLWLPIGLHAGWIFGSGAFSKAAHREVLILPWLGKDLLVGIVPLMLALASWALVRCWLRYTDARASSFLSRTR